MNPLPAVLASEVICTNILLLLDMRAPGFTVPQNLPMRCPLAWPLYISTKSYRHKLSLSRSRYLKERTTTFPSGTCRERGMETCILKCDWHHISIWSHYLHEYFYILHFLPGKPFFVIYSPGRVVWKSYWTNHKNKALAISVAIIFFLIQSIVSPSPPSSVWHVSLIFCWKYASSHAAPCHQVRGGGWD